MKTMFHISHSLRLAQYLAVSALGCAVLGTGHVNAIDLQDTFDRADGALGPRWASLPDGGVAIVSDQVVGTSWNCSGSYRIDASFKNDQYSEITVTSSPLSVWIGASVRNQANGDIYVGIYYANGGAPQLRVYKRVEGTWTQLGVSYACGTLAAGTKLRLMVVGSRLVFLEDGVERIAASDADISAGAPGIIVCGTDALDDWSAGDLAAYSIGGTVSGLTGSLMLQNNGGDILILTQDGPFNFSTPVLDGAAYSVTVLSEPSSQICTVLNGSGTVVGKAVDTVTIVCTSNSMATSVAQSDTFDRADGALGPRWASLPDGSVAIVSDQAVGTSLGNCSGSYRIDASFKNDQYSEITVTSSPLSVWIGASVRNQANGDLYVGIYYANGGAPQLRVYKRVEGTWTQLGVSYACGTLAAGTKLRLMVVSSRLVFLQDGVERIAASDADISAGVPGIMVCGTDALDDWSAGDLPGHSIGGFAAYYISTDQNGIESYLTFSAYNGYGPHVLRVLRPDNPAPVAHNLLYVLPVEPEGSTVFGDGLTTLRELNAHNQYNVTLIAPSFSIDPWYADNPTDTNYQYESFMSLELQPWVTANLRTTGSEQHWLIGFSKSGTGGIDLLFKHPDLFTLGAFWDFPATGFTNFDQFGSSSAANYGTDANFQANYRLTPAFVQAYENPFLIDNRIWISSGGPGYQQDVAGFDTLLRATGIAHTFVTQQLSPSHTWNTNWVSQAVSRLYQNSMGLLAKPGE
jgi:hypothetical protein